MRHIGCSLYSFGYIHAPTFFMYFRSSIKHMVTQHIYKFELPLWQSFSLTDAQKILLNIVPTMECYAVHLPKSCSVNDIISNVGLLDGVRLLKPRVAVLHPRNEPDFLHDCNRLSMILESFNCQLCVEYIVYDKKLQYIFDSLPSSIGITLDFFHCVNAGYSIESVISRYFSRIKHVHLNDYSNSDIKAQCPGEGCLLLRNYLNLLQCQEFQGTYMLECKFTNEQHFRNIVDYCGRIS